MSSKADKLKKLIELYWDCAYAEGWDHRAYDTPTGEAQSIWCRINAAIDELTNHSES